MKKIFLPILLLSVFCSCKKQLTITPISTGTTETFYQTQEDFIQASNAVYNELRTYPDRLMNLSETRSDNLYAISVLGTQLYDPINAFRIDVVSSIYVSNAWNENFNGIFRANTLLQQLDLRGEVISSALLRDRLRAEARFLRAFFYFDLVRYFGKVPVVTSIISPLEATNVPRSPVSDVYKVIIEDLQFAILNLPPSYATTNVGRATKYAAESLLALVYMTRSGPTYGIDGPGLGLNEWALALPLLNDVIGSGLFEPNTNYANIFSYTNQSPAANKEAIFDVMYLSGLNPILGASFVSLPVPDGYFTGVLGKAAQYGGSGRPTSNSLYNSHESTDLRRSLNYVLFMSPLGVPGNRPFLKKYMDITRVPTVSPADWGINFIAIRYTDVLMLKAECILQGAPGTQKQVDDIVNIVRLRVNASSMTNVTLQQLYAERRREFSGEGSRWFDLQRSGTLITTMNDWITADDELDQIRPVVANWILYPVPQVQMDIKPGLYVQNLGYN
ncbi:RagB/SusD family nutrient uptake outer membrane protein [Pedobacter sp. MC2016-14]|uniref:RagB/SusD family nutrient uptake outer membrane protein n=1 Tax=Pedobacter sp. MC2016-14 TaxID=2897327 RepID=UPI001E556B1F|nr:RagB/SusD family nutrient uptake outer membrane protein [Pedobacter sp. MC2016-14]MCD0487473.1 RagB/SusD family nutrient uptake outer membrane protein [Pedobacter sp. MC2016-14]